MSIIPNKLNKKLKLLHLRPALYIVMQKTVILNTCRISKTFLEMLSQRDPYCLED